MVGVVLQVWRERVTDGMRQLLPELVLQPGDAPDRLRFERQSDSVTWTILFEAGEDSFDVLVGAGGALRPMADLCGHDHPGYELFPLPSADPLARVVFQSLAGGTLGDLAPEGARAAIEPAVQVAMADLRAFAIPFLTRASAPG